MSKDKETIVDDLKVCAADVGTGNLVFSKQSTKNENEVIIKKMRNVYINITEDDIAVAQMSGSPLEYVEKRDDDGELEIMAVVGEDAFRLANIFSSELKRAMKDGVVSSDDIDAIDVLAIMWKKLVGNVDPNSLIVYSIPGNSIDVLNPPPVEYHERVFKNIFTSLGFKHIKSLNEGQAVVFSECAKEKFTGLGVSHGAGMTNVSLSYKGTSAISFSLARSGDWIDKSVSTAVNILPNKVTAVKENNLDLLNTSDPNKKTKKVKEALVFYYENLIEYILKNFMEEFTKKSDGLDIDEEIPIVLSGGTSLPKNFDVLFKKIFDEKYRDKFPYQISEIRRAEDPLTSVAKGCLIYGHWLKKRGDL